MELLKQIAHPPPGGALRNIPLILALAGLLCFGIYSWIGYALETFGDSGDYIVFSNMTIPQVLAHYRPPGYGVMLAATRRLLGDWNGLPAVQYGAFVGAVIFFCQGLRWRGVRRRTILLVGLALLPADIFRTHGHLIASEPFTLVFTLLWFGALLGLTGAVRRPRARLGLWLLTFAAATGVILHRPAFLFVPPLAVILGWAWMRQRPAALGASPHPRPALAPTLLLIALTGFAPFFLYGGLRWAVVGHFGLSSYKGAVEMAAIGPLLSREWIPRLAPDLQPAATAFVAHREKWLDQRREQDRYPYPGPLPLTPEGAIDYETWSRTSTFYRANLRSRYGVYFLHDMRSVRGLVVADQELHRLFGEVFRLRWREYFRWSAWNFYNGLLSLPRVSPLFAVALLALAAGGAARAARGRRGRVGE
ncbi:MAG: hypothetical protein HQL51_01240, partial [Magnetococcales bacterium]|nr:hypothetical protein [Magnetococcales bacterium]